MADGATPDPWDARSFDQSFIDSAPEHEPSAAERAGQAATQRAAQTQARRHRRRLRRRRRTKAVVVVGALVGMMAFVLPRLPNEPTGGSASGGPGAPGAEMLLGRADSIDRPTPTRAGSSEPLAEPISSSVDGPHEFLFTQPGSEDPVSFDRCRPVSVVINPDGMPGGASGVVEDALDEIGRSAGVEFRVEEETTERPSEKRPAVSERYGDRWAPALIAWSDPDELSALDGDVAGIGGPIAVNELGSDRLYLVTGIVILDAPQIAALLEHPDGREETEAIVLHELGHLLGLGHVDDDSQLMYEEASGVAALQGGDLAGLQRLADQPCAGLL